MGDEQPFDLKRWQTNIAPDDPANDEQLLSLSTDVLRRAKSTRALVLKEQLGIGYATASRIVGVLHDRGVIRFDNE